MNKSARCNKGNAFAKCILYEVVRGGIYLCVCIHDVCTEQHGKEH